MQLNERSSDFKLASFRNFGKKFLATVVGVCVVSDMCRAKLKGKSGVYNYILSK